MGGEQRPAAIDVMEMLDRRPGDRQAVEGRGAAADLIEDDEGALARLVEDGGGLDHFDHEGRAAARQIIGGADAAEQAVDDADARFCRGNEGAHLRQMTISAFWRRKVDLPAMLGPVRSQMRAVLAG